MDLQQLFSERIGGSAFGTTKEIYKFAKIKMAKDDALAAHWYQRLVDEAPEDNRYYLAHLGSQRCRGRLARARAMFQDLVADDIAAYKLYQETSRLDDGPEKDRAMATATGAAINVPREMTKLSLAMLDDMLELSGKVNPCLITDLLASAALSVATIRLSDYNVRINLPSVADKTAAGELRQASTADLKRGVELFDAIEAAGGKHLA